MPNFRVMSEEEVRPPEPKGASERAAIAQEYDGYIASFTVNQYVEVSLSEDENKQNIRNRLQAAAQRRGWTLAFKRTKGLLLRFKVVDGVGDEATEVFGPAHEERDLELVA